MTTQVLFIRGAGGEAAYEEDGILATSLQQALGPGYAVRYPPMPFADSAGYAEWKADITKELSALNEPVVLVAHSVGGSILLKYLVEEQVERPIIGLFLLATPFFGADANWSYASMHLPHDVAALLPVIPRIALYHCRDDEVVPFAHLARYAARLPQATIRAYERGGHQFGGDVADIAEDIKHAATPSDTVMLVKSQFWRGMWGAFGDRIRPAHTRPVTMPARRQPRMAVPRRCGQRASGVDFRTGGCDLRGSIRRLVATPAVGRTKGLLLGNHRKGQVQQLARRSAPPSAASPPRASARTAHGSAD